MRIAVFSDIHGNDFAFEKVEADIKGQGADQIVCLGDAIQGGPQPAAVVGRLRKLKCPVVMGNADAWMLSGVETTDEGIPPERKKKMELIRQWSLSQLTEEDRSFIAKFKPTITFALEKNLDLLCFHGSPVDFDDVILPAIPEDEFQKFLGSYKGNILTGGHTHAQQVRRLGEHFFFNPGSVGFAYAHHQPDGQFHADTWAEYAIFTFENGQTSLEFRCIPFDTNELIRIYRQSGRPFATKLLHNIKDNLYRSPSLRELGMNQKSLTLSHQALFWLAQN
jgi:putative phosphoesterase